jgi:hypothetical protein
MRRIDNDDDDIVRDGETLRTRIFLTDRVVLEDGGPRFVRNVDARRKAKPPPDDDDDDDDDGDNTTDNNTIDAADHRPGFRYATDATRAAVRDARQGMIDRATSAWRTPQQPQRTTRSRDAEPDMGTSPDELAMRRHLFGPAGLPAASDPDADPGVTMRGHMGELFERSQRARDRAWGSYKDQLSNAWRGRTDPSRALTIERQLERTRGEE